MDIFNLKKVEALEDELDELERKFARVKQERDRLEFELNCSTTALKDIQDMQATIPEDCIPGEYCRACEFVKSYFYHNRHALVTGYTCGKGQSCKNFIQKEV